MEFEKIEPQDQGSKDSVKSCSNIQNKQDLFSETQTLTSKNNVNETLLSAANNSPFITKSMNQLIEDCKNEAPPKMLIGPLLYENEQTILFSATGLGKTILAMQFAFSLAKGEDLDLGNGVILENEVGALKVIYFDFELSDIQLRERIGNAKIPDNLFIAKIERGQILNGKPEEIFKLIKEEAERVGAVFIIIDNMSKIGNELEKSENAIKFMSPLWDLVRHEKYTILILSHTAKINKTLPITTDSLGGSSKISQLADAIIGINEVNSLDERKVYIKQLKTRNDAKVFGKGKVICTEIIKDNNGFVKHECYSILSELQALSGKLIELKYTVKALASLYYLFYETYDNASKETGIACSTLKQRVSYFKRDFIDDFNGFKGLSKKELFEQIKIYAAHPD